MKLANLTLTSGDTIEVSDAVTAIVGPNNSGKSTLLREIQKTLQQGNAAGNKSVEAVEVDWGSREEFFELMNTTQTRRKAGTYGYDNISEDHWVLSSGSYILPSYLDVRGWGPHGNTSWIADYFCTLLNADGRLHAADTTTSYNPRVQVPSNPIQRLYADRALEERLSTEARKAFQSPLTLDRHAGTQISLVVGVPSAEETVPASTDYLDQLRDLDLVDVQGDGFRAFVGMVLAIIAGSHPLVLIDEPEAFLHPPQARLFGQFLASLGGAQTQVIVSTHSEDIIAGLTSSPSAITSIVRLTREGTALAVAQLPEASVKALYDDPLMRYYDMFNGLFARGVVLCEADSDCTYYRAVAEKLDSRDGVDSALHFTHAGGKSRVHTALAAFKEARVPVAAILDIDLLQDQNDFEKIVRSAGGDPAVFTSDLNVIRSQVESRKVTKSATAAKAEIDRAFEPAPSPDLVTSGLQTKVANAMKSRSGWKSLQLEGRNLFIAEGVGAFDRVWDGLARLGIFLVPVGVLENFHKQFSSSNKAKWLRDVLEAGTYIADGEADRLVDRVRNFATTQQTHGAASSPNV
jgi:predicted ATPase